LEPETEHQEKKDASLREIIVEMKDG
jgi:hypothetical protein